MGDKNKLPRLGNSKAPKKTQVIKPSKYEVCEAINNNKKYWNDVFSKIDTMQENRELKLNGKIIASIMPQELCQQVCKCLGIPQPEDGKETDTKTNYEEKPRRSVKEPRITRRKFLHIERDIDSDTDVEVESEHLNSDEWEEGAVRTNEYREMLDLPEREQVTWPSRYLQPEGDDTKNIVQRAADLTDKIAQEFCDYMKELGGTQQSQLFTPKAIKELFEVGFDKHVARSLKVHVKELPTVQDYIAKSTGNPDKSIYEALDREIAGDIRAEAVPDVTRAFSSSLPRRLARVGPRNHTRRLWRCAKHVPQDLVTLKTVWEDIVNLRSVKEYCRWMIDHPEKRRAPYLQTLGMFDKAALDARVTLESNLATAMHIKFQPDPKGSLNLVAPTSPPNEAKEPVADPGTQDSPSRETPGPETPTRVTPEHKSPTRESPDRESPTDIPVPAKTE